MYFFAVTQFRKTAIVEAKQAKTYQKCEELCQSVSELQEKSKQQDNENQAQQESHSPEHEQSRDVLIQVISDLQSRLKESESNLQGDFSCIHVYHTDINNLLIQKQCRNFYGNAFLSKLHLSGIKSRGLVLNWISMNLKSEMEIKMTFRMQKLMDQPTISAEYVH